MTADRDEGRARAPELPEVAGCFGPTDVVPLISDLIPGSILDAVVLGYCRRQPESVSGLLQNDGRLFPEEEREHHELFCDYCQLIRSNPAGEALCRRCDAAAVKLLLGEPASEEDAQLIQPATDQTPGALRYYCHAGQLEIVVPVQLHLLRDNQGVSVPIGAFWGGQCCVRSTSEMQPTFERLHARTSIPVADLERAYKDNGRNCLTAETVLRFEQKLLEMAAAISQSVTTAYHQREHLRGDQLAEQLANDLAELLRSVSAEASLSQVHQQMRETLLATLRGQVEQYHLRCSALYRVVEDKSAAGLQLTPLIAYPARAAGQINVPWKGAPLGEVELCVRRGDACANARTAHDPLLDALLDAWHAAPATSGIAVSVFRSVRTGLYLWVLVEDGSPWYVLADGLQPSVSRYLHHALARIVGFLDALDLLGDLESKHDELERTTARLRHEQAGIQQLVVRMAHLVSRPILELQLAADLLKEIPGDMPVREDFDACLVELRRAARMFRAYESLTASTGGYSAQKREPLDVGEVLEETRSAMKPLARRLRRSIELEVSRQWQSSPRRIRARHDGLREIMENLVHNALKYSLGGRPVEISLSEAHGGVQIDVTSYGCEIAEVEWKRVFELNYRSAKAREFQVEGSGIGLWVAARLAAHEDGEIEVTACDYYDDLQTRDGKTIQRFRVVFRIWFPIVQK